MWPGCTRSPTAAPNLFSQPRRHALLQAVDPSAGLPKLTYFLREHFYFCLEHLHAGHRGTMLHLLNLDRKPSANRRSQYQRNRLLCGARRCWLSDEGRRLAIDYLQL